MLKRVYLVRHGQKVALMGDPPLTEFGRQQAQATAEYLAQFPIEAVVSSPLKRAQETAEFIAEKLHLPLHTSSLLKERINWGDDPQQSFEAFLDTWRQATLNRQWQPPVGDSSIKAGERMAAAVTEVVQEYNSVVLVTHGDIIGDFLRSTFNEADLRQQFKEFHKVRTLGVPECSVTIINIDGAQKHLVELVHCAHLSAATKKTPL